MRPKPAALALFVAMLALAALAAVHGWGASTAAAPSPGATPTREVEARWSNYTTGYSVGLPPGWRRLGDDVRSLSVTRQNEPVLTILYGRVEAGLFVGIEESSADLTSVSIVVQRLSAPSTPERVAEGWLEGAKREIELKIVGRRGLALPAGPAHELRYAVSRDGHTSRVATAIFVVHERDASLLNFETSAERAERYAPLFEKIAQSFRWIG